MVEPRLIDANALTRCEVHTKFGGKEYTTIADVPYSQIENAPTIDPETLPLVQELHKQVDSLKDHLSDLEFWERHLHDVFKSAAEDRAAVKAMRKHCEQTISELRKQLEHVTSERDKAVNDMDMLASFGCFPCEFCAKKHNCSESGARDDCKDFQWERVVSKEGVQANG